MTEKLRAFVAIELVGEAPVLDAVPGSIINHVLNEIEIEALPADMPERIEVDISKLETAEDLINVADLDLGDKITVLTDETELVVSVSYVAEETEPEDLEDVSMEPEVMERGKKDEEDEE
jgi:large subunit ribosomal protein L25